MNQLKSTKATDRKAALATLAGMGTKVKEKAGKQVCAAMMDPVPGVALAAKALEKIDPGIAEDCVSILTNQSAKSIANLGKKGPEAINATPILVRVIQSQNTRVQYTKRGPVVSASENVILKRDALNALLKIAPSNPVVHDFLAVLSRHQDHAMRHLALTGFGLAKEVGNKKNAVVILCAAIRSDTTSNNRVAAIHSLENFLPEAKDALELIKEATADRDPGVRKAAEALLPKLQ